MKRSQVVLGAQHQDLIDRNLCNVILDHISLFPNLDYRTWGRERKFELSDHFPSLQDFSVVMVMS